MATTNNQKRNRKISSFTISEEARNKLRKQSETTGITQSRILEKLIERMEADGKLNAIICKLCAEEDFEKWASSHNRQYVDKAKISVFVPEAEREPAQSNCMEQNNNSKTSINEQADDEEWKKLMTELYGENYTPEQEFAYVVKQAFPGPKQ